MLGWSEKQIDVLVTTNLVSKWERGQKRPSGPALKLLSIVKAKGLEALA